MRDRALLFVFLALMSASAQAQVIWQPTPAPLVTAENTIWFAKGEPVEWNGDLYYQDGVTQFFNPYQMVRSGVFRGIPLYSDTMLEPYSTVFVPLAGGRMQPYKRPSQPQNLGSLPFAVNTGLNQAPAAPTFAPARDDSRIATEPLAGTAPATGVVGTSGRSIERTVRVQPVATVRRPTGVNNIWINFEGRRWLLAGKAIAYEPQGLKEVGKYHGWSVYTLNGDASTIYIPTTPGMLAPYRAKTDR